MWICVHPSCTDQKIYINSCYFVSYFFASSFLIRRKPCFYSKKLFFLFSPCSEFMLLNYYERVHGNFYERVVLYCTANQRFFSRLHACMSVNHRLVCKSAAMWIQKNVPFALSCVSVMDGSQESKSVTDLWPGHMQISPKEVSAIRAKARSVMKNKRSVGRATVYPPLHQHPFLLPDKSSRNVTVHRHPFNYRISLLKKIYRISASEVW